MIEQVSIKNFKTLKDISVPLKPLNLLTGLNGTGKSSFIQVLLLLRQSALDTTLVKGNLKLNGNLVQLGKGKEILYQYAEKEEIEIEVTFSDSGYKWDMYVDMEVDYLGLNNFQIRNWNDEILDEALFQNNFQYLNTDHIGPQEVYQTSLGVIRKNQIGWKGEYAVHFLNTYGNRFVPAKELQHPKAKSEKLLHQVDAWMGEISPNIKLNITEIANSDLLILGYQYTTQNDTTKVFQPRNVGFGISYVLPIIVSLLLAVEDKLIILENPEAHLHSRGQSRMGKLMALASQTGAQIIVETHSDHILNGIRVAAKKAIIPPDDISILYFDRKLENREHRANILTPKVDKRGRLTEWPEGFFDEWDNMLDELI